MVAIRHLIILRKGEEIFLACFGWVSLGFNGCWRNGLLSVKWQIRKGFSIFTVLVIIYWNSAACRTTMDALWRWLNTMGGLNAVTCEYRKDIEVRVGLDLNVRCVPFSWVWRRR
jgi:hypothetical protein